MRLSGSKRQGRRMRLAQFAALAIAVVLSRPAAADDWQDCRQGDADKAVAACTQIIGKGPPGNKQVAIAYTFRGIALRKKGDPDKAIADLSKAIGIDPRYAIAYNERGIAYRAKGENDKAIADYSKFIELDPKSAVAYANRGIAYSTKGEADKAIADYAKAIEIDPRSAVAYNERGNAYRGKGASDLAIADFTKAIEIDPKHSIAYANRGSTYRESKKDYDRAIADLTKAIEIDPKFANAYNERGIAYRNKAEYDKAIADHTKAIDINPRNSGPYVSRGLTLRGKGEHDKAIADFTKALEITPKAANAYHDRGFTYRAKGERDLAIADFTKAIEIDPKYVTAYLGRGVEYRNKGEFAKAIADYNKVIEIDPKSATAYNNRGLAHSGNKDHVRALADYTKAIEFDPKDGVIYSNRGKAHEAMGNGGAAMADYEKLIALPASSAADRQRQEVARERIARLKQAALGPASSTPRRVALVIGNSNYANTGVLPNPTNDARAIAAALNRLGFAVTEHHDLTREKMGRALKDFGDRAEGAEWAVVFFAGHGLEINGAAYLVPIDAELKRDSHVSDETLSLTQVQAKVDAASKLGLIILDACRNNPFLTRMVRVGGASRSIGRGLSQIEPEGNVLVAYAAKHGTTADDGAGQHSPFTEALLSHIEEPGLEINFLFRKVRDRVRERTAKQQEPFLYGSLGSEPLYFKAAATAR